MNIINEGENEDKRIYIDSPQNLKALIDLGSFDNQILKYLEPLANGQDIPKIIQFKTNIPKQSNSLKISYETSNIEQGLQILGYLNKLLLKKYYESGKIKYDTYAEYYQFPSIHPAIFFTYDELVQWAKKGFKPQTNYPPTARCLLYGKGCPTNK